MTETTTNPEENVEVPTYLIRKQLTLQKYAAQLNKIAGVNMYEAIIICKLNDKKLMSDRSYISVKSLKFSSEVHFKITPEYVYIDTKDKDTTFKIHDINPYTERSGLKREDNRCKRKFYDLGVDELRKLHIKCADMITQLDSITETRNKSKSDKDKRESWWEVVIANFNHPTIKIEKNKYDVYTTLYRYNEKNYKVQLEIYPSNNETIGIRGIKGLDYNYYHMEHIIEMFEFLYKMHNCSVK